MDQPHDDGQLDVRVLADLRSYIEDQCKIKWISHMTMDNLLSGSSQIWGVQDQVDQPHNVRQLDGHVLAGLGTYSSTRAISVDQPHDDGQLDVWVLADPGSARSSGSAT